jgi:two-component system KDP operon response regulator KdpE
VRFGPVAVDRSRRQIDVHGTPVHLTPTEYKLLMVFLAHPGVALNHQQIFDRVWGRRAGDAKQYLRVYVANIRKKLEPGSEVPRFFQTVPGVGYRFVPETKRHR